MLKPNTWESALKAASPGVGNLVRETDERGESAVKGTSVRKSSNQIYILRPEINLLVECIAHIYRPSI